MGLGVIAARQLTYDPNSRLTADRQKARAATSKAMTVARYRCEVRPHARPLAARQDAELYQAGGAVLDEIAFDDISARKGEKRRNR